MSLTDEQEALRRTGITATDAAAILLRDVGGSPTRSELDVYRHKKGEILDAAPVLELEEGETQETPDAERGNFLEPALVAWAGKRLNLRTEHTPHLTIRCAADPLILASPDGWAHYQQTLTSPRTGRVLGDLSDRFPMEAKAPRFGHADEWGPDGADAEGNVPAHHEVQLRMQMCAANAERGFLAALLGPELRVYRLVRDREWERKAIAKLHEWWERHIVADVPPAVSASERDQRWLKARYPNDKLPPMRWEELTDDQQALVKNLLTAYRERGTWGDLYEKLQAELKEILGDHGGLHLAGGPNIGGRIDWKSNKPGAKTDWEAFARELHRRLALCVELARHIPHDRVPPELVDVVVEPDALCRSFETEVAAFTKTTPGNRMFKPYPKGKK